MCLKGACLVLTARLCVQDAFENYTQTMNWSAMDPSFAGFAAGDDPNVMPPNAEESMRYAQNNGGGS